MKVATKIFLFILIITMQVSCKKNHTCTCTTSFVGPTPIPSKTTVTTINDTKLNAYYTCTAPNRSKLVSDEGTYCTLQ